MPRIARPRHLLHARGLVGPAVAGAALMLALAGCGGGDGSNSVKAAEARVSAKERAVTEAKADLADKSAEFCGASQTYITALDRYGDVLNETTTTVGDVHDAGTDLEQPREDATAKAEAAVKAQQAVVDAKQELADAKAALAEANNPKPTAESTPTSSSSPKPLAPAATVNRVKQAESEFRPSSKASPTRPRCRLPRSSSTRPPWLWRCPGCGSSQTPAVSPTSKRYTAEAAVRDYTTALQQSLHDAGYYDGAVDGVYGPATVDAVKALQQAHGLPSTGAVDKATAAALQSDLAAKGGAIAQEAVASTAAVQQTLKLAGFWDGPVDGAWTPELTKALKAFQTELGVKPTGTVDEATIAALEKAMARGRPQPSPSATSDPTPRSDSSDTGTSPMPDDESVTHAASACPDPMTTGRAGTTRSSNA